MKKLKAALVLASVLATSPVSADVRFFDLGPDTIKCDGQVHEKVWFNNFSVSKSIIKAWAHIRANIGATGDYGHGIFRTTDELLIAGDELDVSYTRGSGDLTQPWDWPTGKIVIAPGGGVVSAYWCAGYLPNPLFNLPASATTGTFQAGIWVE